MFVDFVEMKKGDYEPSMLYSNVAVYYIFKNTPGCELIIRLAFNISP